MVGQTAKSTSPIALAGTRKDQRSRKRDASARYSALQGRPHPSPLPEGEGTSGKSRWHHETPPRPANGPGRILFSGVNQLADDMEQVS